MDTSVSRAIPSRYQALSGSFSTAIQSESTVILTYLLNNVTPRELHERITTAVRGRMMVSGDIDNLLMSLQIAGVVTSAATAAARDETTRHCVRCHATYLERDNGLSACVIRHDRPQLMKIENPKNHEPVYIHFYRCCNKAFETGMPLVSFPHFSGRHTTLPENVHYNATNIVTCHVRNCNGRVAVAAPIVVQPSAHSENNT